MATDALDGDVRRLRSGGRGGGNGDPLGYSPVRSEGTDPVSEPAFHLTPLDVRKQEFRRSLRGYEPLGVEDFRARVADELERILDGARASQGEVERQSADVQRQFQAYVAGFRALLERQLAELRALDGQRDE